MNPTRRCTMEDSSVVHGPEFFRNACSNACTNRREGKAVAGAQKEFMEQRLGAADKCCHQRLTSSLRDDEWCMLGIYDGEAQRLEFRN